MGCRRNKGDRAHAHRRWVRSRTARRAVVGADSGSRLRRVGRDRVRGGGAWLVLGPLVRRHRVRGHRHRHRRPPRDTSSAPHVLSGSLLAWASVFSPEAAKARLGAGPLAVLRHWRKRRRLSAVRPNFAPSDLLAVLWLPVGASNPFVRRVAADVVSTPPAPPLFASRLYRHVTSGSVALRRFAARAAKQHEARPDGRASLSPHSSTLSARRDRRGSGSPGAAAPAAAPAGLGRRGTARRRSSG